MERLEANLSRADLPAIIEKQLAESKRCEKIVGLQRKQHCPHTPHSPSLKGPPLGRIQENLAEISVTHTDAMGIASPSWHARMLVR